MTSLLLAAATIASCREPTQVTFEIRTDVPCPSVRRTAIVTGAPTDNEQSVEPTTVTSFCQDGFIGTLVTVPASSDTARLAIRVVSGIDADATECSTQNGYRGCIVQRRRLGYLSHTPLFVPITMYASCKDIPCGADQTCNRFGQCVTAELDPRTCTQPNGCTATGEVSPDAGFDATLGRDSGPDGGSDALADSGSDGGVIGDGGPVNQRTEGGVLCGGQASPVCNGSDDVCCFDTDAGRGILCTFPSGPCPGSTQFYYCDGREDCPSNMYCCDDGTGSSCIPGAQSCSTGYFLCHDDTDCKGFTRCVRLPTQPYGRCQ